MAETDWREILSFSQKELIQADKEKLCESLSWMEADDIELNFGDLKTLFRLAQDILKFKSEQVNNLHGQMETIQRKSSKSKTKTYTPTESPGRSSDSLLDTIAHQEDVIKANKEILEQLYADIAELESKKNKLQENADEGDRSSESSRDVLSELNQVAQLENEITMKNKHLRKLLSDVKVLEEENSKLKEKVTVLKEKLTEATNLIETFTEQLFTLNNECAQLKDALGNSEENKAHLSMEIESLKKELAFKEENAEKLYGDIKSKVQHWKNVAKAKKSEIENLSQENTKLKESLIRISQPTTPCKDNEAEEIKTKQLQEKLSQASKEIEKSADLIQKLKTENRQLKSNVEESIEYPMLEIKNECDDNKEKILINKLKKKIKCLTFALQEAEERITIRDRELADITSQLQLVQSDEGINTLLEGLKNKKRQLKGRDEGIKSLVQEINNLNQLVDNLQLENESLRQKFNVARGEKIPTKGILKQFHEAEEKCLKLEKLLKKTENNLIKADLDNRSHRAKSQKMLVLLKDLGFSEDQIDDINQDDDEHEIDRQKNDDDDTVTAKQVKSSPDLKSKPCKCDVEMQGIINENEGLRKGLQEILSFLKDNSTTSSGVLTLECPSLDKVLQSLEARHSAGWFAPHMSTVMELRAALGGKDALLTALHEARKETFEVMSKLSKETQKSLDLEKKLQEVETIQMNTTETVKDEQLSETKSNLVMGDFGSWMSFEEDKVDFYDKDNIESHISRRNSSYEDYLKRGLGYFHDKFKILFEKMTSVVVQTADQQNQWSIQEEQYKAQMEHLKIQLSQKEDEDISEDSPGLIASPSSNTLQRKCTYLEESYKYIRTLNENMKNELLECKKESMLITLDYETQIQSLMLIIANLFDKLRYSISIEVFWKQNSALNESVTNYRKLLNQNFNNQVITDLFNHLDNQKGEILNTIRRELLENQKDENKITKSFNHIENSVLQEQLKTITSELEQNNNKIKTLEAKNLELQELQTKIIDDTLSASTKEETDLMKSQLQKLADDNKILREQCQHISSHLDIALLQLQDKQQRQMNYDMEINMLRHQILDLQATGDNKAIIARLSGEVLVAHLQASESHKKIEKLNTALNRERQARTEAEEMLKARQKIFDIYALRYESKFKYMFEVMQILRQQYHGSLPLASIENYLNKMEELSHKTYAVDEKLQEIEDLQYSLMTKHSVFEQVLDLSKNKCIEEEDGCPHKLKNIVLEGIHSREEIHSANKLKTMEQSRADLAKYCNKLENTLVLLNQGFEKSTLGVLGKKEVNSTKKQIANIELEDIQSDDDSSSKKDQTITLSKPQILHPVSNPTNKNTGTRQESELVAVSENIKEKKINTKHFELKNVSIQTSPVRFKMQFKSIQTDTDPEKTSLKEEISNFKLEVDRIKKDLHDAKVTANQKAQDAINLNAQRCRLESTIENLRESNNQKDALNESLRSTIEELKRQSDEMKNIQIAQRNRLRDAANEENKSLLLALKQLENEKNTIVLEYKQLLENERDEYSKSMKELNIKIMELQSKLDSKEKETHASNADAVKEVIAKYTTKITHLEDKCFKVQSELDGCRSELKTYQSEVDRWKDLASERLSKMEQLDSQLEERHCHEVESYKAENQHWLSQLNETQREHMELRSRLSEQKALYVKQLSDKDAIIEQLRSAVQSLKTQILSMQTMISVNDPSFDLSAIVEVDETSDALSHHGSDRLELRFDSAVDFHDMPDDIVRMPATSTAIWQEPVIERLRREKQLAGKQNAILRRQIKALAARERRARLDAQNLKNQIFRISTSGSKVATAETAALQSKIASLQAQLTSARRDTNSSIALWDKWKRSQQAAERWQARFEEKCQEVKKLEANLNLAKSAVVRLEKEKRILLSRLAEIKHEQLTIEKQESEAPEKSSRLSEMERSESPPPVPFQALLDRVQAQQRRIAALEVAEKGNELLVSEYERALAEITSLKGQVLKLESTLLESQIRTPLNTADNSQPEIDYWKSYCEMLKEENVQLNLKVNALETPPATAYQHRVTDLEQTVLTLRGLVSKLQAEQKSSAVSKRSDSRPSSGRSTGTDKGRRQMESHRIEIANLKRSIQDKDLLLEKSKEMLKIAAEREDELLRENDYLRQRIEELTGRHPKEGFSSV